MGSELKDFRIPDSVEPLLGYRRWKVLNPNVNRPDNEILVADWNQVPWDTAGPMKAECHAHYNTGRCSSTGRLCQSCRCGLHSYYRFEDCNNDDLIRSIMGYVVGITANWGTVFFDNLWMRAEYAKLLALVTPEKGVYKGISTHRAGKEVDVFAIARKWCATVAEKYNVPMLPLYEAELLASEYGVWVEGLEGDKVKGVDVG